MDKLSILFVCTGNICRSPTARGVMQAMLEAAGLQDNVIVDAAGTHDYFVGEPPDVRAQVAARRRGYSLSAFRARHLSADDFEKFDLIVAMDLNNLAWLQNFCPEPHQAKLHLMMEYAQRNQCSIVPDPYPHDFAAFEQALDFIEDACQGLVQKMSSSHPPQSLHTAASGVKYARH